MSEKKGTSPDEDVFEDSRFGLIDLDFEDKPNTDKPKEEKAIDPRFAKLDLDPDLFPEEISVEPTADKDEKKLKPPIIPAKKAGIQVFLKPRGVRETQAAQERRDISNLHESVLVNLEQKIQTGVDLNRNDLLFLYGLDVPVKNLQPQQQRRIKELLTRRNTDEDMCVVFECGRGQIAHSIAEISEDTKAYVGQLEPGIFQRLPENLEHVYTSFPDKKIRRENVEIGGKSAEQLISEMEAAGINISDYAKSLLKSRKFVPGKNPEEATLIRPTVADLGFKSSATTDQICKRAQILVLELCPADTGPNYRLKYRNQPLNEWIYMGMKQITDSDGSPHVFRLVRDGDGLWLFGSWADPFNRWTPDDEFVFRLRKPARLTGGQPVGRV